MYKSKVNVQETKKKFLKTCGHPDLLQTAELLTRGWPKIAKALKLKISLRKKN